MSTETYSFHNILETCSKARLELLSQRQAIIGTWRRRKKTVSISRDKKATRVDLPCCLTGIVNYPKSQSKSITIRSQVTWLLAQPARLLTDLSRSPIT